MTIISIRQPGYIPYMGFFKKIQSSNVFVYLDDVQYERGDWDNRNKIHTAEGSAWLTVPVLNKFGEKLNEVKIDNTKNWNSKHRTTIKINYQNAPFFQKYWEKIEHILNSKWEKLIDLNLTLIEFFNFELGIKTKTVRSSELQINSTGSQRLLEICQKLNADTYLSGPLGKNYLDEKIFSSASISIVYEKFEHPQYHQMRENFIPNLSIIDLLFNEGAKSKDILLNSKNM